MSEEVKALVSISTSLLLVFLVLVFLVLVYAWKLNCCSKTNPNIQSVLFEQIEFVIVINVIEREGAQTKAVGDQCVVLPTHERVE